MRSASAAPIISPVSSSFNAIDCPTSRGSRCVPPYPGINPSFTSGCPSFAVSLATRIVHAIASSHPPPSANPLITRDHRLPAGLDRPKDLLPAPRLRLSRRNIQPSNFVNIRSRRERLLSRAGQQNHPHSHVVRHGHERMFQLIEHLGIQRMQHLRPVQRHSSYLVLHLAQQRLVVHRSLPSAAQSSKQ